MNFLKDSVLMVTGGTGSFGNAVVKRLLLLEPKKIIIFSRDELKQEIMRNTYNNPILDFVIGDIRDSVAIHSVMEWFEPDYVFHAAALKQVPAGEIYPMEYIKTNVLGSYNVFSAAIKNNVERVVILTTDKAVYPVNAMGMSKALMEKLMVSVSKESKTIFCGVRYGNVLYSRGSAVPFFISLIKQGLPIQITNPNMTRFLITLDDAVNLVLETLETGKTGEIYVRRSPACTVGTLAEAMCQIFSYKQGQKIVGARTGEKIHETLIASPDGDFTSENARRMGVEETKKLLLTLPEIQEELKWLKSA
jgi:UDP-N-acetylglucosamine 4,6-dehydratase